MAANDFGLEVGTNEVSTFKSAECVAQVVDMRSLTPLEDAQGGQVSSKG